MVPFHKPRSLEAALELLREVPGATPLSGGQTLVPMLNLGLAQPGAVVSLNAIDELRGIESRADGSVRIGALTRHAQVADCAELSAGQSILRHAAAGIANVAVRRAGTIGGACAHGDPSTNWPAALVAADARIELGSGQGRREVPAQQFFVGFLATALAPGELVTAIIVPPLAGRAAYYKHVHVSAGGSVLTVGVVAEVHGHTIRALQVAVGAAGPTPLRLRDAERALVGAPADPEAVLPLARQLAQQASPDSDMHGSADYKRSILPHVVLRTCQEAFAV